MLRGLGGRAAVVSGTRLLNQSLLLISPLVLVRLLPIEEFGRYREFLLYAGVLLNLATLGINSSLLRFVPERPELKWRYVRHTVVMMLATTVCVGAGALALDAVLGGKAMGEFALPAVLYMLLFANLDFWEFLLVAEKRPLAVLTYTTGRLVARMTTVICAAALTQDVQVIVWSLVGLEAVRLMISFVNWRRRRQEPSSLDATEAWRDQLRYCTSFGGSMLVISMNKSLAGLFVAKMLGPVALAHYAIGTYTQPVITVVRNSLSDVLLAEMAGRNREQQSDRLLLWRRTTVVNAVLLIAAAVVLARFAETLVATLFTPEYRSAALLFQLYLIGFIRDSIDFSVPLRAIDRPGAIMRSNLLAMVVNAALLALCIPVWGVMGTAAAFFGARICEGVYLARETADAYGLPMRDLAPWRDLAKVAFAALLASGVLYGDFWTGTLGVFGVAAGGAAFLLAYAIALMVLGVPEVEALARRLRLAPAR